MKGMPTPSPTPSPTLRVSVSLAFEFVDAGAEVEVWEVVLEDDVWLGVELVGVDVCRVEDGCVEVVEDVVGLDVDVELSESRMNRAPLSKDSLPNTTSKWKPFAIVRPCSVRGVQL
jgi:hypothetical protein